MSRSETDTGELKVNGDPNTPPSPFSELQLYGARSASETLRREGRGVMIEAGGVALPLAELVANWALVGDWIS
jgi:hypothetical protein